MALFKVFRGDRTRLDSQQKTDGHAYFCPDDGSFHIDYTDADGNLQRKQISAKDAETLSGLSLDELKAYVGSPTAITNDEIDAICGNIIPVERLEGDGQEFYTTAPSTLSFRSTAPLNELQGIQINGETVDPSNYTLEEGSTIVKLSHEYLSTFDAGEYELSVISDSKTVKGNFTIIFLTSSVLMITQNMTGDIMVGYNII